MLTQEDLKKLFDDQIQTLKDRGCPEQIVEMLQNQKNSVLQKTSGMTIGEKNIPFLPVIKPEEPAWSYSDLMSLARNGDKKGHCYLNPTGITDEVQMPNRFYYLYDIEDGEATLCENPEEAIKIIREQSRLILTAAEVANLCIVTDVLSRHGVWAPGSRYYKKRSIGVPVLIVDYLNQPALDWSGISSSNNKWGSPSCGSR